MSGPIPGGWAFSWFHFVGMRLFAVIMLLTLPSLRACALVVCLSLVGACSVVLRDPVPEDVYLQTSILGREDLRFWRNQNDPTQLTSGDSISWSLQQDNSSIMHTQHNYLAISGAVPMVHTELDCWWVGVNVGRGLNSPW